MTDAEFAKIKARFPGLRWKREPSVDGMTAVAVVGIWAVAVRPLGAEWWWSIHVRGGRAVMEPEAAATLGRCLRSLECAIVREAKALAGLIGQRCVL